MAQAQRRETTVQRRERRISAWGMTFTYTLVLAGIQLVAGVFAPFYFVGVAVIRDGTAALSRPDFSQTLLQDTLHSLGWILIACDVVTLLIFILIVTARRENFRKAVGLRPFKPLLVVALLMLGAGLSLMLNSVTSLFSSLFTATTNGGGSLFETAFSDLFATVPGIIAIVVCAPVVEEITFRGLVFGTLREKLALPAALIIQALFFGLVHGNISQFFLGFGLGCLMCWVVIRSGSIYCSMLIHFAFNGTTTVVTLLQKQYGAGSASLWALLLLGAAALFVVGLLWQMHLTKKPKPAAFLPAASGGQPPNMLVS